jgi:serine/threonine-protein kinase
VAAGTPASSAAAPSPAPVNAAPPAPPKRDAGTLVIAAVGLADPSDPRYKDNAALLQSDVRADSRAQLVEKAVGFMVDEGSLAKNYDLVKDRLLANSGSFVKTVTREGEPRVGKDGLISVTAEGVVDVKAVQKSLNQMSRDQRVVLIRASGNPKVAVRVAVRDADHPNAPAQPSPVAENILKERIKSFGFRTWTDGEVPDASQTPDFSIVGEAAFRKLSMRLEASGVTVTKYALTSWTVKCIDRSTGEEIYYNTALPKDAGSFASLELALQAIGTRMGNEFSRDFFLAHASVPTQRITLTVEGMPDAATEDLLLRELVGLPSVVSATSRPAAKPRVFDVQLAGSAPAVDIVAGGIVKPLSAKLGQPCFSMGGATGDDVRVVFDAKCADPAVIARFESNPPAGLYRAPPARQKSVTRNPETLRKLAG